jgi:hypothetical protein
VVGLQEGCNQRFDWNDYVMSSEIRVPTQLRKPRRYVEATRNPDDARFRPDDFRMLLGEMLVCVFVRKQLLGLGD